ncbi:hypothetical protein JW921_05995 [Candidatus Fermentibacterales bacterium]|nr:hypothetical protein [Candidatus Fermentibacterales bacterium]
MGDVSIEFLRGPDLEAIREAVDRANARGEDEVPVLLPSTGQLVMLHRCFPKDPAQVLDDERVPS